MSLAYFPLYADDFEADTAHLTLAEDGAYNRLLRLCWRTPGCSLPADKAWIYRRARAHTDADKAVIDLVLDEFFVTSEGRSSNARLTKEWLAANEAHERRKNAGKKGGKAKALKTKKTGSSNAEAMSKQPEPEPEPYIDDDDRAHAREFRERLLEEMGVDPVSGLTGVGARMIGTMADMETANRWKSDLRLSEAECLSIVREVMRRKRDGPPRGFGYFTAAMSEFAGIKRQPKLTPIEGGRNGTTRRPQGDDIARAADAILAAWG